MMMLAGLLWRLGREVAIGQHTFHIYLHDTVAKGALEGGIGDL